MSNGSIKNFAKSRNVKLIGDLLFMSLGIVSMFGYGITIFTVKWEFDLSVECHQIISQRRDNYGEHQPIWSKHKRSNLIMEKKIQRQFELVDLLRFDLLGVWQGIGELMGIANRLFMEMINSQEITIK